MRPAVARPAQAVVEALRNEVGVRGGDQQHGPGELLAQGVVGLGLQLVEAQLKGVLLERICLIRRANRRKRLAHSLA